MRGGYTRGGDSGVTLPEVTAWPALSYAVHFHGFGPLPNGNAKSLAPPTVTGRTLNGCITEARCNLSALPGGGTAR
jgi:hypothetical protein